MDEMKLAPAACVAAEATAAATEAAVNGTTGDAVRIERVLTVTSPDSLRFLPTGVAGEGVEASAAIMTPS